MYKQALFSTLMLATVALGQTIHAVAATPNSDTLVQSPTQEPETLRTFTGDLREPPRQLRTESGELIPLPVESVKYAVVDKVRQTAATAGITGLYLNSTQGDYIGVAPTPVRCRAHPANNRVPLQAHRPPARSP